MRNYKPQTIRQAKAEYKKSGGAVRLSDADRRRLERQVELDRRAQRIQYRENQKKLQHTRKLEQEQLEREKLCENGIGLATQLAGFNHTQAQMKRGMETFLGISKGAKNKSAAAAATATATTADFASGMDHIESDSVVGSGQSCAQNAPDNEAIAVNSKMDKNPWDDDDLDDGAMCSLIASAESPDESSFITRHEMEKLPNATKSSFNTSFSFSDIDGAILAALHASDELVDDSSAKDDSNVEYSPGVANISIQNSLADLADEFVVSNTQIQRELT